VIKKFGKHQIATIGVKRGEKYITLGSLHFDMNAHWCAIKFRSFMLGRFTSWKDKILMTAGENFQWPYIKGTLLGWHGHGVTPTDIGYIYTEVDTKTNQPIYSGELYAIPATKIFHNENGYHYYVPVSLEDTLEGDKGYEQGGQDCRRFFPSGD